MKFTGNDLVLWLQQSLYTTSLIPMLPAVIFHMRQHDYTQLAQIYDNGVFTTVDAPGSLASEITSIGNDGTIVGDYIGADGIDHGYTATLGH